MKDLGRADWYYLTVHQGERAGQNTPAAPVKVDLDTPRIWNALLCHSRACKMFPLCLPLYVTPPMSRSQSLLACSRRILSSLNLLALLSLLYVTCMGLPLPVEEELRLFVQVLYTCQMYNSVCVCCVSTLCTCPWGHVFPSVSTCLFSCLRESACMCVSMQDCSLLLTCVYVCM